MDSVSEKPLVVGMSKAEVLLDCGTDRLYDLIKSRELESFLEGRVRKITMASIEAMVARRVAAAAKGEPTRPYRRWNFSKSKRKSP